jgi:hypothetical protein
VVKVLGVSLNGGKDIFRACLGNSGMTGNEGHWGGGISTISQKFPKSPSSSSIHLNPPFPKQALIWNLSAKGNFTVNPCINL